LKYVFEVSRVILVGTYFKSVYVNKKQNIIQKEIRAVNFSGMNLGIEKSNNSRNRY